MIPREESILAWNWILDASVSWYGLISDIYRYLAHVVDKKSRFKIDILWASGTLSRTWFLLHSYLVPTKVHSPPWRVLSFAHYWLELSNHIEDIWSRKYRIFAKLLLIIDAYLSTCSKLYVLQRPDISSFLLISKISQIKKLPYITFYIIIDLIA